MCGINAIFAYHLVAPPVNPDELIRVRDHMTTRGPDGAGMWISPDARVGLGHRRLSIIDLSDQANQPFCSPDQKLAIVFNGEIYNYHELKKQLQAKGYCFRTTSDTEVLLYLYAEWGTAGLEKLRGMFAFALWDANKQSLLLARDPYGIKPLYYADDGWTVRVASQVKALLASKKISQQADPAGVVGFYLFGCVPEPFTLYEAIHAVPAGHYIWVNELGASVPVQYYCVAHAYSKQKNYQQFASRAALQEFVRDSVLDSVKSHLVADVPVGAFLSGGIDSGALVGLMHELLPQNFQTVTLGFREYQDTPKDESTRAELIARHYQTHHTTRIIDRTEFNQDLPLILEKMDQPSQDGVNTWFVSKAAHELGIKVAISGLGGDELFGGYNTFKNTPKWSKWMKIPANLPLWGDFFRVLHEQRLTKIKAVHPKLLGFLKYTRSFSETYFLQRCLFFPWELYKFYDHDFVRLGLQRLNLKKYLDNALASDATSSFEKVSILESTLYMRNQLLKDTDWASMAHSLEVRVPLVDVILLQQMARIAPHIKQGQGQGQGQGKLLLANLPQNKIPQSITDHAKTGFSIPIENWLPIVPSQFAIDNSKLWAREVMRHFSAIDGAKVTHAN